MIQRTSWHTYMNKTEPTPQRYWLKEHQITAFWHGFGLSNGLTVPVEHCKLVTYKSGTPKQVYRISPEYMRDILAKYVSWLEQYASAWNMADDNNLVPDKQAFVESEQRHESRADILKMIELLQAYRIDD